MATGAERLRAALSTTGVCLASFVGIGGYLYHDARIVNTEYTSRRANDPLGAHEKTYKVRDAAAAENHRRGRGR
jgi:hypothetical protein